MDNQIERWIRLDALELERQAAADPLLPQRLRRRLADARAFSGAPSARLARAFAFCLLVALLTFIHLQWLPRPAPGSGRPALQLTPWPAEAQNTFYRSFVEVARWEE